MSEPPDHMTWTNIGAVIGSVLTGLGIGRATKRDRAEDVVDAIREMAHTLDTRLADLHADIKLLLDRDDRRRP
jgi:hypothetical protein